MTDFIDFCRNRGIVIPDETIEEYNASTIPGSKVRVVDCIYGHEFEIGQFVTIELQERINSYKCTDGKETWWLSRKEFQLI